MREIKFRIYDKQLKESNIVELHDCCGDDIWCDGETPMWDVLYDSTNEQESFVALQYTGLKDKNGKEIYEGDVIKIDDDYELYGLYAGELYQVYYGYGAFRLKPKYQSENKGACIDDAVGMTVVGNIYDNPELIEE